MWIPVVKDSRRSSSRYTDSLFFHVVKHDLLFSLFVFFLPGFSFTNIHDSQDSRWREEGGGYLLISFLPFRLASESLRYQLCYCCRDITSAHSWQPEPSMEPLIHVLSNSLFLQLHWYPMLFREYLTWVTLGNISCVLLNLTKNCFSLPKFTS